MEVIVIDSDPSARAMLLGRLQELKRARELQSIEPVPLLPRAISERSFASVAAIILGPGLASSNLELLKAIKAKAHCPIAALFHPSPAGTLSIAIESDEDLKLFLVRSLAQSQLAKLAEARKIIGVVHFTGGVGASTLVQELGETIAKKGNETTLVDLDDVSTALSVWCKAGLSQRAAVSDALKRGTISEGHLSELLCSVSERLTLVPQPESYAEAFHFKANVLENAPVASLMINSLLSSLRAQDRAVIIDFARSWGLASFAALPRCGQILFVISASPIEKVRHSIECLRRFKRESDAADEFDTSRWIVVVTRCAAEQIEEATRVIAASNLFPAAQPIVFLSTQDALNHKAEIEKLLGQML